MIQAFVHSLIPWLDITALVVLIGAAMCLLLMVLPAGGPAGHPQVLLERLRRLIFICLSMLVISSIFGLIERSMEMSGFGLAAALPLLSTVVFKSHYGSMWLLRLAGLIAAWIVLLAGRRYFGSPLLGAFLLSSGAAIAFARSASGHPSDFGDLSPQQLADWLHLLAVSAWGGCLVALAAIFPPPLVKAEVLQQRMVAVVAERVYLVFGPLLTVIVYSGLYNAWFQVGSFQALVTTPYGGLLSAKILFLLFLALRYIAPPQPGRDEVLFATKFLQRTRVEAVIILALLLCAALLVHQIPARHYLHLQHMQGAGGHAGHGMNNE